VRPQPPSPALIEALSSPSATPGDVAKALAGAPRKAVIGTSVVDLPTAPSDPRGAEAVAQVQAALARHGAPS
jgi:hypothetical protein